MRRFVLVIVILNLALRAAGQINPPSGANYFDFYRSPMNLGAYPSVTTSYGPSSQRINPSFDAKLLRPMFGVHYAGLVGAGSETDEQGYKGHLLSLGALLPNSLGVLGLTLQTYRSTLSQAALGTGIEIGATFAKDVLQDLSVGGSLRFAFAGYESDSIYAEIKQEDWALLGDIGFVHRIEESGLSNLRWGVVLSEVGKGLGSGDGFDYTDSDETITVTPYPAPFTLISGVSASLIDAERFRWDVAIDLSFPSFQNVELGIATRFKIADFVTLGLGTSYNLRELIPDLGVDQRNLFPGVSLVFNFDSIPSDRESEAATGGSGADRVRIAPAAAFAPMSGQTYAFGLGATILIGSRDATPPVIDISYPGPQVLSPLSEDFGISYPISVQEDRYITRYEFRIDHSSGETVWERSDTHPRFVLDEGSVTSQALRGFTHQYRSLELPSEIVWDGAVGAAGSGGAGSAPPDGDYLLYVEAEDDGGNVATAGPFAFSVDGSSPIATVELPELGARIFSPNNDGNKETLTIRQQGSIESLWEGEILRGNSVVRSVSWANEAPSDLVWDGTGESGSVLTDGTYRYRLSSTDEAGNRTVITSDTFVLNTQSTPITVGIDRGTFSPNRDGQFDELTFSLGVPVQAGIVEWRSEIVDAAGATVRDHLSRGAIPRIVVYDGRDDAGEFLADGVYYARLSLLYENGNNPAEISPSFEVDVTPPEVAVTADLALFSPNGDGNKDFISFFQDTSAEDLWIGEITTGGVVILRSTWRGTADQKFVWDGHAENGLLASNGIHQYQLNSTDRAGNVGRSTLVEFEVNYEDTAVGLTRSLDAFSPNADGSLDEQLCTISLDVREGVESYEFSVYSSDDDTPVRRLSERAVPESTIEWQGVTDAGGRVGDGSYYAEILILYANGNRPKARTRPFVVDTTTPTIRIEVDTDLFSPNQDGNLDSVTFRSESSPESLWEGVIRSSAGAEIRRIFWPGITSSYVWNGTDEAGNLVPDGVYYFEIATVDEAGNSASARTEGVRLDTRLTSIYISVDPVRFSPNRDGKGDTVNVSMSTAIRDGVSGWSVEIRRKDGALTRSYSGERIAEQIVWDGRDRFGRVVEGEYTAQYSVTYEKGDTPIVLSSSFYLDISSPELSIVTAPSPFSPDEDGVDDALVISVTASDASGFDSWDLVITDPTGVPFRTLSGAGRPPRSIQWDGSGDDGDLVLGAEEYRFTMNVSDTLGNRTRATGVIPVDVLLFRFGTGFRMSISNIIFRPNSPLLESDSESVENNEWVLGRIAELVNRYRSYDLRIEGHAVSLQWEDSEKYEIEQREELLPLSEARAETVAEALKERGVAAERITSIGLGGARPIVPHGDEIHRWKNRRMEFVLLE